MQYEPHHNTARASVLTVFYAKDMPRLADFYQSVLGLERVEVGSTFIALGTDGDALEVVVVQAPPAIADAIYIGTPPEVREQTPIKASFAVAEVEPLRARIEQRGGALKPASTGWSWRGFWHLDGNDPEGNVFQLRQREAAVDH